MRSPHGEPPERPPRPAPLPHPGDFDALASQPEHERNVVPPGGWGAVATWAQWRHYSLFGPPSFLAAPALRDEANSGDGAAPPSDEQPDHTPAGAPSPRWRRVAVVILIELLAATGFVGALVAWTGHNLALGMFALGTSLAANLILWTWARGSARRRALRQRGTGRGHS